MNKLELLKLIANAPKRLKGYSELLDYARNAYKQMTGVFPEGIDNIAVKQAAKEAAENRSKIIEFPKEKITDPFTPRPGKGELSVTIEGQTKNMTPEGIMDLLMGKGKAKDVNIGTAPKTKKTKPAVDPELQAMEDQNEMFQDFSKRIRDMSPTDRVAERLKDLKGVNLSELSGIEAQKIASEVIGRKGPFKTISSKGAKEVLGELEGIIKKANAEPDLGTKLKNLPDDIPDMADGGRIGFDKGGEAGFAGDPMEGDEYVMAQPQQQRPMGPVFQTNDPGAAAKEVMARMAGSGLTNIPMGRGFGLDFGLGARRSIDAGISFNPQNPNFNLQLGVGALQGKPVIGAQFRRQFKDGSKPKSPGRRTFMKTMAGLASLPFVGKLFKPAAKVAEAGPAIAEGVKLGFDKFMMLVDKIKRLGRKTDRVTQTEREEGFIYTGKDGSQYELVEDLATGDLRITKDKPGVAVYGRGTEDVEGIDVIDDRSTFYLRRNRADETTKGKKPPDEYDEVRELPDEDGTFTDVDEVSDNTVNEILEELGETRTKKASGGLAYMLGE